MFCSSLLFRPHYSAHFTDVGILGDFYYLYIIYLNCLFAGCLLLNSIASDARRKVIRFLLVFHRCLEIAVKFLKSIFLYNSVMNCDVRLIISICSTESLDSISTNREQAQRWTSTYKLDNLPSKRWILTLPKNMVSKSLGKLISRSRHPITDGDDDRKLWMYYLYSFVSFNNTLLYNQNG